MTALVFRRARVNDLPAIVAMLADDGLGAEREDVNTPLNARYLEAFAAIETDPNQLLLIAEKDRGLIGSLQITFIPGLSYKGAWRGQIESVRVARPDRGGGVGSQMIRHAIEECRSRGCNVVQLTTNKSRVDAQRFYAALGFVASHEGMKLAL